jgi:hypothetical protein
MEQQEPSNDPSPLFQTLLHFVTNQHRLTSHGVSCLIECDENGPLGRPAEVLMFLGERAMDTRFHATRVGWIVFLGYLVLCLLLATL